MPETPEITYHDTDADIRAIWKSLCNNGGYRLYVDSSGNLHATRLPGPAPL